MVAMWLQAALQAEGVVIPGYRGVVLRRNPADCLRSVERLMAPEDLGLLIVAYQISGDLNNRITLLKLVEALTLKRFIVKPMGPRQGWGPEVYQRAFEELDAWLGESCRHDFQELVSGSFAVMGAPRIDPLEVESCPVWQRVLLVGDPGWWAVASRRLYECGGPWVELSVLQSDSETNRQRREWLVGWFQLRQAGRRDPRPAEPSGKR
jgi:hypothetical protein